MPFYAVARGRTVGTFRTWNECKRQVHKFPDARFKKFDDLGSAEAFIKNCHDLETKEKQLALTGQSFPITCSTSSRGFNGWKKSACTSQSNKGTHDPVAKQPVIGFSSASSLSLQQTSKPQNETLLISASTSTSTVSAMEVNPKRKFQVTEDRVVPMTKRPKLEAGGNEFRFNHNVDLSNFTTDDEGYVVVYTDGACKGNGKKRAQAGIGVWFGDGHHMNISLPVEGDRRTNNTAEIQAAEKALWKAKEAGINKLNIRTDSQFVINCMTKWINNWRKKNWVLSDGKPVQNRVDLEKLSAAAKNVQVKWSYVQGHSGHHGNEEADKLAVAGSWRSIPVVRK